MLSKDEISSEAVILNKDGSAKLDDNNLPTFIDSMEWPTNNAQLSAILTCCKALLDQELIPHTEAEGVFGLMDKVAALEKPNRPTLDFNAELPINYFVGMLHVLNMTRQFELLGKEVNASITTLALDLARRIEAYHAIKNKEDIMDTKPEEVKSRGLSLVGEDKEYF